MVLPQMDHFVGKGGENFLLGPVPEVRRIKGDLIGERAVGTSETIAAKIPVALLVALKRDETIRKRGLEESAIQKSRKPAAMDRKFHG